MRERAGSTPRPSAAARARRPGALGLTLRQAKTQTILFLRTPRAMFFTVFFPLLFLFVFNTSFSGYVDDAHTILASQYFTPRMAVFAVISSCYTALAISLAMARDAGILKRIRGTPLSPVSYMAARILSCVVVAVASVIAMLLAGMVFYHVKIASQGVPAAVATLLLGAACFCALGFTVSSMASSGDAAPAVVNATLFPVLFISGIFFPVGRGWLSKVANVFPIRHFANALAGTGGAFDAVHPGAGWHARDLAIIAAWTVGAIVVALRTFTWEPKARTGRARRGRSGAPDEPAEGPAEVSSRA
jgi:ABC-2 type transport system permease protein